MDSISDVANIGGGGALVGWVFFFIIVGGAYFYNNTTSYQRYRIKRNLAAIFGLMVIVACLVWLVDFSRYLLG